MFSQSARYDVVLLKWLAHASVAVYLLNIPTVNNLTVCHPCRQPGPFCLLRQEQC